MYKKLLGGLGASVIAAVMSGCSSSPVELNYYLLHSPQYAVERTQNSSDTRQIHLKQLMLPDYLKQRGLAMQTGPATVYFSSEHVWAEPLSSGLLQALTESLWQQEQVQVLPANVYNPQQVASIDLQIDDLITTHNSEVLLKGMYWVHQEDQEAQVYRFNFRTELEQDGFSHAVEKMRVLVKQLAADMAKNV